MSEYNREKKKRIVAFSGSESQQWEEWMGCQNFCFRRCDMGMDAHWSAISMFASSNSFVEDLFGVSLFLYRWTNSILF